MNHLATVHQVMRERVAALESITAYIEYLRPEFLPDFDKIPAAHHRLLAQELQDLANNVHDRTAVSLPPGSAKSFYCSIVFPTWLLARDPTRKILCLSPSESLGEDFSRRRRQIMLTDRWQALSCTALMPDAKSLQFQGVKEGGGIYMASAGSVIQGLRADALIPDDIVTGLEQAGNLTQLDKTWNWYISEARSRLRPGGIELMVATRWALADPIGRVLKLTAEGNESWRYVRVPMICDSDDDPIGRVPGERLWTEYFTERMVSDAQRNPIIWNTLYQQRPAADEFGWVPPECIRIEDEAPQMLRYYIGVDISLGVTGGDYTVFAVVGIDVDGNFWLVDVWRKQADPDETARKFVEMAAQYKIQYAWVEDDNASRVWARLVHQAAKGKHAPLLISKMKGRDKETRAAPLRSMFIQQRVRILNRPWKDMALKELAEFPAGKVHDDFIDAFGVVAKELHRTTRPKSEIVQETLPIHGAVQLKGGKLMTTQTLDQMITLNAGRNRRGRI